MDIRLERNTTPNRLAHKPTKRNLEWSDSDVRRSEEKYRMNSFPCEIKEINYLRLDNTNLSAEEAAKIIKNTFNL